MTNKKAYFDPKTAINKALGVSGFSDTLMEEKYVIGCAISHAEHLSDFVEILRKPSMFTTASNREVWATLIEMNSIGMPVEFITVLRQLRKNRDWKDDLEMYKEFIERAKVETAKEHAKYIYANYCVRRVKTNAKKIWQHETTSVDELKSFLINQMKLVDELGRLLPSQEKEIGEVLSASVELIENPTMVIPFPIKALNEASGGMTKGHISILGGRTGHGKTTTLANCVDGWLKMGYRVRWYSREQKAEEMMQSCIFINTDVDRSRARKGTLTSDDKKKIKEAVLRMSEHYKNLVIKDDIDNMDDTIADIVSCREKPDIIIDDFIQLINVPAVKSGKRYEIEDILKTYHWLQKRYGFSTLMASQLSRAVETRQFDNEPRLSDLAEASFIEQLSENVILLWWEYKFLVGASELDENEIKFIFGKTRFGKTGHKILRIDEKTGKLHG